MFNECRPREAIERYAGDDYRRVPPPPGTPHYCRVKGIVRIGEPLRRPGVGAVLVGRHRVDRHRLSSTHFDAPDRHDSPTWVGQLSRVD